VENLSSTLVLLYCLIYSAIGLEGLVVPIIGQAINLGIAAAINYYVVERHHQIF
jgi:hypothetical protein